MSRTNPNSSKIRELFSCALDAMPNNVEGEGDFKGSNLIYNNRQTASTLTHRGWALLFSGNTNSGKYRDRDHYRPAHTVQVQLTHKIRLKKQVETLDLALDDADLLIETILRDQTLRAYARVAYVSTTRNLTPTGNFILAVITFDLEHSKDIF